MDLKRLLAGTATEDLDKLMAIIPLLKERAELDRAIALALAGEVKPTPKREPEGKAPKIAPAKRTRKASSKKAKAMKADAPKPVAQVPVAQAKELTMKDAAIAYLKGRKEATMAELVKAVAKAKKIAITPASQNVISVTIYKCKALKRTGPGRFALA